MSFLPEPSPAGQLLSDPLPHPLPARFNTPFNASGAREVETFNVVDNLFTLLRHTSGTPTTQSNEKGHCRIMYVVVSYFECYMYIARGEMEV